MKLKAHHLKLGMIAVLKGSGAILNILMAYFLMNYASAANAGIFFFIISAINIISYAFRFGSDNYLIKLLSTTIRDSSSYKFVTSLYLYNLASSTILFVALLIFKPEYSTSLSFFSASSIFLFTAVQINSRVLQAEKRILASAFSMSTGVPFFFLIGLIAYQTIFSNGSVSVETLMIFYALGCMLVSLLSFKRNMFKTFRLKDVIPHYRGATTFLVTGFVSTLILWGGQFFSGLILNIEDVSTLATIQRVSMAINLLLVAASIYISPLIAQAYSDGNIAKMKHTIYQANAFIAIFGVSAGIFIFIFSSVVLNIFNIPEHGKYILFIICTAQIINVLTGNSVQILNMTGFQKYTQKSVLMGGIVFVVGCTYCTINPSLTNIAITISIALVTQNLSAIVFVKQHLGFYPIGLKL